MQILEKWLGWQDSNLRMRESKSRALPTWRHPIIEPICTTAYHPQSESLFREARTDGSFAVGAAMGWVIGLEPMTPRATTWYSNQLSYTHHIAEKMVRLKGLEPPTHCLEGSCSIHLSYRRIYLDISSSVSHWSGRWESNPRYQLGRLEFYH